jgi:hypothetical protein
MLVRIEEIIALDVDNFSPQQISPVNVDMEMLCQQVINNLQGVIQDKKQQVYLSIQEGSRLWLVDRRVVQPMIYYLVAVMLDTLPLESQITIRIDRQNNYQSIQVTSTTGGTHLPRMTGRKPDYFQLQCAQALEQQAVSAYQPPKVVLPGATTLPGAVAIAQDITKPDKPDRGEREENSQLLGTESWCSLGLLLSYQLAQSHGGKMLMQENEELGYGYVVILPQTLNN